MVTQAKQELVAHGFVSPGDRIAVAFGLSEPGKPFQTDPLKLLEIE